MPNALLRLTLILAAIPFLGSSHLAVAAPQATTSWTGAVGDGDFFNDFNWSNNVPRQDSLAQFLLAAEYDIVITDSPEIDELVFGNGDIGFRSAEADDIQSINVTRTISMNNSMVELNGANLSSDQLFMGESSDARIDVTGGSRVDVTNQWFVDNGSLLDIDGGAITSNSLIFGSVPGSTGNMIVDGGTVDTTALSILSPFGGGNSRVTLRNGAKWTVSALEIGSVGNDGRVDVFSGSLLSVDGIIMGGELNVSGVDSQVNSNIGLFMGGEAAMNISDAGKACSGDTCQVAEGTVMITTGGRFEANSLGEVGLKIGSGDADVVVNGGVLESNQNIQVGVDNGTGSLLAESGRIGLRK